MPLKNSEADKRLLDMNQEFVKHGCRTIKQLMFKFKIARSTVFEDLEKLENKGADIKYDKRAKAHRCHRPADLSDNHLLTSDEINQIRNAVNLLASDFGYLPEMTGLPEILEKMQQKVRHWQTAEPPEQIIFFEPPPKYEGTRLLPLFQKFISENRRVRFNYLAFHAQQPKTVLFDPYFLREYDQRWYVGGQSLDASELNFLRTFPLERIEGTPEIVGANQTKPKKYDPKTYWNDIFGISRPPDGKVEEVILKFETEAGKYFLSKPFYPNFEKMDATSDGLTIRLQIIVNNELIGKIAALGNRVQVIAPEGLKEWVCNIHREALAQYI